MNLLIIFIIIQANRTHRDTANVKKLDINIIDKKYHDKIIFEYINFPSYLNVIKNITNDDKNKISWKREYYQRDYIKYILNKMADDNDLCIISDLDEICNYRVFLNYLNKFNLFDSLCHHINITFIYNSLYSK